MNSVRRNVVNQGSHLAKKLVFSGVVLAISGVSYPIEGRAGDTVSHSFDCGIVIIFKYARYFAFKANNPCSEFVGNYLRGMTLNIDTPAPHKAQKIELSDASRALGGVFSILGFTPSRKDVPDQRRDDCNEGAAKKANQGIWWGFAWHTLMFCLGATCGTVAYCFAEKVITAWRSRREARICLESPYSNEGNTNMRVLSLVRYCNFASGGNDFPLLV